MMHARRDFSTTPLEGKRFRKPKTVNTIDPELKRLRAEKRKTERALDRLMNMYLYDDNPIGEKDFIIRKQALDDYLKEINESLGMIDRGHGIETISDENFIKRASYFIMGKELADKDYIYFIYNFFSTYMSLGDKWCLFQQKYTF